MVIKLIDIKGETADSEVLESVRITQNHVESLESIESDRISVKNK